MVAADHETSILEDSVKRLDVEERIFHMAPQVDEIVSSFLDYRKDHPKNKCYYDYNPTTDNEIVVMQALHLGLIDNYIRPSNIIEEMYRMKWFLATSFLFDHDKVYGYEMTKKKMQELLQESQATIEKYPKFLIDAYMDMDSKAPRKSKLSYEAFQSLKWDGWRVVTIISPSILGDNDPSFIDPGISGDNILLQANGWFFSSDPSMLKDSSSVDSTNMFSWKQKVLANNSIYITEFLHSDSPKKIYFLTEEYTLDSIVTVSDKLKVWAKTVMVPNPLFELLSLDFSKVNH
jgi:hypothetical protein